MEKVIYVEYSGTPERYWSLSGGAFVAKVHHQQGDDSPSIGGGALLLRNEGRVSFGIGISGSSAQWKHQVEQVDYLPFVRQETFTEIVDSFGKLQGIDTVWVTVTSESERSVADSTTEISYSASDMCYKTLGVPIQIGYEFKSGFLFARAYIFAEPGILLFPSSEAVVFSSGAGIQSSYLLHPRWAIWAAAQYAFQYTDIPDAGGQRQTQSLHLGMSYIWGGE